MKLILAAFLLLFLLAGSAHAQGIRSASAVDFNCTMISTATSLTEITGCAALTGGKSYYIESFNWSSSIISTTTNFMLLQSGTATNCGSNTTSLYAGFALAFTPAGPGSVGAPIKVTANHALCFVHPGAGTRNVNITGFIQ